MSSRYSKISPFSTILRGMIKRMYFVYILECADKSLYTGITTDVERRLAEHKEGKGGHYTRARGARRMVYVEKSKNRSSASKREAEIKRFSLEQKTQLVQGRK
jgi:putative endonuclease